MSLSACVLVGLITTCVLVGLITTCVLVSMCPCRSDHYVCPCRSDHYMCPCRSDHYVCPCQLVSLSVLVLVSMCPCRSDHNQPTLKCIWNREEFSILGRNSEKSLALLMFHALTGCDTVSAFVGHGTLVPHPTGIKHLLGFPPGHQSRSACSKAPAPPIPPALWPCR